MGVEHPLGRSPEQLLSAALGKREVSPTTCDGPHKVADSPDYAAQDEATSFSMAAATKALSSRQGLAGDMNMGIIAASITSNLDTVCRVAAGVAADSYRVVRPADVLTIAGTHVTGSLSCWLEARAFAYGTCTGSAAGTDALVLATMALRRRRARRVLVVGTETPGEATTRLISESEGPRPLFRGGAAIVMELASAEGVEAPAVSIGSNAAGQTIAEVASRLCAEQDSAGLVFLPSGNDTQRAEAADQLDSRYPDAEIIDLWPLLGDTQGVSGILQGIIAATWLKRHPGKTALMISGSIPSRHIVAMTLSAPES
jgi:hypothetical protein